MTDINSNLKVSQRGLQLIMRFEGFSAVPYNDAAGNASIGYGHKLRPGENYLFALSNSEAQVLLHNDVSEAEKAIHALVTVKLGQAEYDALVSFIFNTGTSAFADSTLLKKLNNADYAGAADEFAQWNKIHTNGSVEGSPGLAARRAAEAMMFREDLS